MSTPVVRSALTARVKALEPSLAVHVLSDYLSVDDLPLNDTDQCLLLDFVTSSEQIRTLGDTDSLGFEETGTVAIHWLCPTGFDALPILEDAEDLRLSLRGSRISNIIVEAVEPFADSGSPIDVDGRWTAYSSLLFYSLHSCG